ncbi:DUF2637 domain-containing protein [Streptomyces anulatus]|uniref:DUF2637 domain-containing protein n=1 Tax=Streptomyces anulatus TaxID=1892 RepID=A0A6G3T0Y6_STRAQ|nr:DUF2637 domain-containing protein [Streptomyces anulatus]NEB88947.1 DUF2637 domain-containing protein [Streptomyces anulatus]
MTSPSAHPAVAPIGLWDRLAIVVLGLAGCALSYDALQQMAVAIHIRGHLTYLFPLVIDGFIAYGVRALLVLSEAPLRARLYIWVLFGTATAASIWANSLHAVRLNQQTAHTTGLRLGDTVVAILSTLAPLALAGAVHLYILITRHHPGAGNSGATTAAESGEQNTGQEPDSAPAADRTCAADQPGGGADHGRGPVPEAGPASADHPDPHGRGPLRTTDHPTGSVQADHENPAADHRTDSASEQAVSQDAAAADQQISDGPHGIENYEWTEKTPGQSADSSHGPVEHDRADHGRGPDRDLAPASTDQAAPADQMPDHEHPRTTDQTAEPTADQGAPSLADQDADGPADQDEDDSSGEPQGAPATDHEPPPEPRTTSTDQNDEVPWEVKVEVAREAALEAGRMTRRVIRPHLRRNNITISNEGFRELQAQLYADPALAHLPRDTRRSR